METFNTVNDILVGLFRDILLKEEKAIITEEFKDISGNDMHILEAIGIGEAKNMSTVAGLLQVTVGTLTIGINNLVAKGYVERIRSEKDRRVVLISLTEKGSKAYRHHEEFHTRMTEEVIAYLSEEEIVVLVKALRGLSDYFAFERTQK